MLNNEKMREKNISVKFWILKKNTKEYLKYTFFFFLVYNYYEQLRENLSVKCVLNHCYGISSDRRDFEILD